MKVPSILWILAVFHLSIVYAHQSHHDLIKEIHHHHHHLQPVPVESVGLKDRIVNYVHYLHALVAQVRLELATSNTNQRPSTPYSLDDILFAIHYYLPIYPSSQWQQEPTTRRRQIARVLNASPVPTRPYLTQVRDSLIDWTKTSQQSLHTNHTLTTLTELDSLIQSIRDFIQTATDKEMMVDPLFLSSGYVTLDDAIKLFLTNNRHSLDQLLKEIHRQFNQRVCLSGALRRPLESVRQDAMDQTRELHNSLLETIEPRLLRVSGRVRHELQLMAQEVHKGCSSAIRQHTANALLAEVDQLHDLKSAVSRSASYSQAVWSKAAEELVERPTSTNYWADVMKEVKQTLLLFVRNRVEKRQLSEKKRDIRRQQADMLQ